MKKNILILIGCVLLVGCTLGNTPTARVEDFLSKYQMLDDSVNISYTSLTNDTDLSQNIINRYEDVIKRQYRDFSYEVKDEVIDGDVAVVTIEVEVRNYGDAIDKYDINDYDNVRYHELILDSLEDVKEMVTYTLDITLTKNDNDMWTVDTLSLENRDKLLGIY